MAKVAIVTGAGTGVGRAAALALMKAGYSVGARRAAQGAARGRAEGRRRQRHRGADRRDQGRGDPRAVRDREGEIRPARRAVQQCRHGRAAGAVRGAAGREVEGGRRHEPHRAVRLLAGSLQDHEGPEPARRPHHQQRLDLGAHAAPALGRLHVDQARRDRPHQVDRARRARIRHRLLADRHRQRRDADDRPHGAGRAAAERRDEAGAAHGRRACRLGGRLHGEPAARRQRAVHDRDGDEDAVRRARG